MKCKNNGSSAPIGYYVDKSTCKLAIDQTLAPIVHEIFERYANGQRMTEIADWLNDTGLKTSQGNEFKNSNIGKMLRNRKYIGEYRYNTTVIPNGIPAIIDYELFDRVQRKLALNRNAPARSKAPVECILTTKLFCGTCGGMMIGDSGTSKTKGRKYNYYKCHSAKRHLGCKHKSIRKDWIERVAVLLTVQKVLKDDAIDRIADAIIRLQDKEDTTIPAMERQLKDCEKSIDNLLNAIQAGILTSSTKERLEQLEKQRDDLKVAILQVQLQKPKYTKEQIVSWIGHFKYGNINDEDYCRELIDTFLNSIYVYDDRLLFTYNFKDGTETVTMADIESAVGSDLSDVAPPKRKSCR